MNRRDLFKFMGAGAAALLVPTTYFLPPAGGWVQKLKIRRIEQYVINRDEMVYRYDAAWDSPSGAKQCFVDASKPCDEQAIMLLKDRMAGDYGTPNSAEFKLALPRGYVTGHYIYA